MKTIAKPVICLSMACALVAGVLVARAMAAQDPPIILDVTFGEGACDGMHLVISKRKAGEGSEHTNADCAGLQIPVKGKIKKGTLTLIEELGALDAAYDHEQWRWHLHADHTYSIERKNKELGTKKWQAFWTGTWLGDPLPE